MESFQLIRLALIITVAIYFIYDKYDEKIVRDEREEYIRLKTYELVHRVTTSLMCIVALAYFFDPTMDALYPVLSIAFGFLYTEIIGKIYFRRKY